MTPAQTEQARRYLRRRREVLLCVLVSLLGVLVARSIPLVEHEQEVCKCREALNARDVKGRARFIAHDVTLVHPRPLPNVSRAPLDLVVTDEGAWLFDGDDRALLAHHCDGPGR